MWFLQVDNAIIQMVECDLKVIFCFFQSWKFDFGEVEKKMFQGVARHRKLIFFLLTNPKCDLGEVKKAMFQGLALHSKLILDLWTSPKCDLHEFEKVKFQWHSQLFSAIGRAENAISWKPKSDDTSDHQTLRTHFLPLGLPKMRLGWSRKSDVSRGRMSLWTHILISKCDMGEFEKAMFHGPEWHSQLILGLWTNWKFNLMKSKNWWIKLSNVTLKKFFASWPTENTTFFQVDKATIQVTNYI